MSFIYNTIQTSPVLPECSTVPTILYVCATLVDYQQPKITVSTEPPIVGKYMTQVLLKIIEINVPDLTAKQIIDINQQTAIEKVNKDIQELAKTIKDLEDKKTSLTNGQVPYLFT